MNLLSGGPVRGKREWQTPTLTALGDVRAMTEGGGVTFPDGGGNNSS